MNLRHQTVCLAVVMLCGLASATAGEFFVAPHGNDAHPGTQDAPFATLERARDAARQSKGSTVTLAAGTHRRTTTFALDERDSGTTYRALPGATARISGGVAVPPAAVKPVTETAVLERLLPEVRGAVRQVDLRALGIEDLGAIGPRGFRRPYIPAPLELFVDDEPLTLAQWPAPGQPGEPVGKVLDPGPVTRNGDPPSRGGTFEFKTGRPARWTHAADVWITGLFANGYADSTVQVKSFDLANRTLTTVQPHMYGFWSGNPWNRWTALNLLEEISAPGEFAIDKASGRLYFLPPANRRLAECRLEVSLLQEPLLAVEGGRGVVFDGLVLECSRGMGVYLERGADNRIRNCTLRNLGMVAACIGRGVAPDPLYRHGFTGRPVSRALGSWHEHIYENPAFDREAGTGHGIVNCRIYNIGAGAVSLGGGNRVRLQPGGNFVENCCIHRFNRWDRTYKGAVNIDGVGNRIAHCRIYDAPGVAIYLHGNDHLIEYNDISRVMMQGDDMGAFYMGRDPTERGNVIRYNYWHDLAPAHLTMCLYFDDCGGDGTTVYGNVFYRAGSFAAVFINNSSDLTVRNNLFVQCATAVRMGEVGAWRTKEDRFEQRMKAVAYDSPPWRARYPEFQDYLSARAQMPRGNVLAGNLLVRSRYAPQQGIEARNNRAVDADPGFMDAAAGNFALKPGADVGIPGFQPIPFAKIGLLAEPPPKR